MLAALGEAAGYAGGGLRTTGRRAGRLGTRTSRRAWDGARRSGERATVAYRVFRGAEPPVRRRPLEFLGAAAVAGAAGAVAVLAVLRYRARAGTEESRTDEPRDDTAARPDTSADTSAAAVTDPSPQR